MKHILPIITLTTLAAAASAQSAAPAGLSYNQISISRSQLNTGLGVQSLIGSSNVLLGLQTASQKSGASNNGLELSAGYVFRNVVAGIDATVSFTQPQWESAAYGINLRRSLSEIFAGLEVSLGYADTLVSGQGTYLTVDGASQWAKHVWTASVSYNINKQYQVSLGRAEFSPASGANKSFDSVSVRYNF